MKFEDLIRDAKERATTEALKRWVEELESDLSSLEDISEKVKNARKIIQEQEKYIVKIESEASGMIQALSFVAPTIFEACGVKDFPGPFRAWVDSYFMDRMK